MGLCNQTGQDGRPDHAGNNDVFSGTPKKFIGLNFAELLTNRH